MKTNKTMRSKIGLASAVLAAGLVLVSGNPASAQTTPANLSPGLQEVVKLTQAHMGDDVITAYIKNSGQTYNLSSDDILYLSSQGVSQAVLTTLLQARGAATPAAPVVSTPMTPPPAPVAPPPPAYPTVAATPDAYVAPVPIAGAGIDLNYFQGQLAPYGSWVDAPPYGPAWRPNVELQEPGWRPYFNGGHWEYTESGWYWQSDYPIWGDIVFHYGRWLRDLRYGWVWVPGYDWAPAWVAWRQTDAYAGWAPLPPYAYFEPGVGLMFRGRFGMDLDFGLGYDDFVFVGYDHFWARDYRAFGAPVGVSLGLFRSSLVINNYTFTDGRFVVEGLGRDHIELVTHHPIVQFNIVLRDPRIAKAREVQRALVVRRVDEIRNRPANDPLRRDVEERETVRRTVTPERGTERAVEPNRGVAPERGDVRTPETDTRGTGRTTGSGSSGGSRDSRDGQNQNGPGR